MSEKTKHPCPVCSSLLSPGATCPKCLFGEVLEQLDSGVRPSGRSVAGGGNPRTVGEYELIEELGRGGMGIVWRARQRRLNREVALKLVREGCLPGEAAAKRFRREAEAAAAIQHPHIVTIHEVGEADDQLYLIMELVPGGSLADWMKRVAFSAHDAAQLVAKVARAVHHAHQQGVLHRDLKPANILLDGVGEPRVCDFGLARLIEDTSTLTMTGEVLGTPAYLSPEQASGTRTITCASDTYSLGAILYEMLSGRPPFAASSLPALLRAVAEDDPQRPISRVSGRRVPVDLSTICLKCLEKEPHARYSSALALAEDLERWIRGEPIHARPVARVERVWKWARRKPLLAGLWLSVTLLTVGVAIVSTVMTFRLRREKQAVAVAAERTQHALARSLSDSAQRYFSANDWLRALPGLAKAIEIETGDARLDEANRIRFGVIRRISPKLALFAGGEPVARSDSTMDGSRILLVFQHHAEVRDTVTGHLIGKPFPSEKEISGAAFDTKRGNWVALEMNKECLVWEPESGATMPAGTGILYSSPEGAQYNGSQFIIHDGVYAEVRSRLTGDRVSQPLKHQARVTWAVVLSGMNRALTSDADGQLYLWDTDTSALVGDPFHPPGTTKNLSFDAFDPISKMAVLHASRYAYMLNCETGGIRQLLGPDRIIKAAADADNGDEIDAPGEEPAPVTGLDGKQDGVIRIRELPQSFGLVRLGSKDKWMFLTRNNEGALIRDLETGNTLFAANHGALGFRGDFSSGGSTLATQSWNGSTRVWKADSGRALSPLLWQAATPGSCKVDPFARWVLTQGDEPAAKVWQLAENDGSRQLPYATKKTAGLWFAGVPERLFLAEQSGAVAVWETAGEPRRTSGITHPEKLKWCGPAAGGTRIFTAGNKQAILWDSATGEPHGHEFRYDEPPIFAIADPFSERLAIVEKDGLVRVWDPIAGRETKFPAGANTVQFGRNGRVLLTIGDKTVRTWDLQTGQPLSEPMAEPPEETRDGSPSAILSPDGSRVLQWDGRGERHSKSGAHSARVWDSATGKLICSLTPHWLGIESAAFSPDGTKVITGGGDYVLRLCDASTGQELVPPMHHPQKVDQCGFSADGLLIWTTSGNDVTVWESIAGEQVTPRLRHPRIPSFVVGSADGRHLAVIGVKEEVRLWDLQPEAAPTPALHQIARTLSAHAIVPGSSALRPLQPEEARSAWEASRGLLGSWPDK